VLAVIKTQPKIPPSRAQANFIRVQGESTFVESLKELLFTKPSFFLVVSYGKRNK